MSQVSIDLASVTAQDVHRIAFLGYGYSLLSLAVECKNPFRKTKRIPDSFKGGGISNGIQILTSNESYSRNYL